jgi:hypothetical protein
MLENQLLTYRTMHEHFLKHFLIPNIARFMGWREISVHMREFKMADDMQMKQMLMSLNQMRKISDKTLLSEFGKDSLEEAKMIEQELLRSLNIQKLDMLYKAQIQGEAQQVQTKYQIKSQEAMMNAQRKQQQQMMGQQQQAATAQQQQMMAQQQQQRQTPPSNVNVLDLADAYAKKLSNMQPQEQAAVLQRMQEQSPQLHQVVQAKMTEASAMTQEPLPEQRPPRRENRLI